MARRYYVVFSGPVDGREDEYNDWYDNTHLADVLRAAGFEAAQRFELVGTNPPTDASHKYMAIYEIDTDDIDGVNAALARVAGTEAMQLSDAMDLRNVKGMWFAPITERRTS